MQCRRFDANNRKMLAADWESRPKMMGAFRASSPIQAISSTCHQIQEEQSTKSADAIEKALQPGGALPWEGPTLLLDARQGNGCFSFPLCPDGKPRRYGSAAHNAADLLFTSTLSRTRQYSSMNSSPEQLSAMARNKTRA